MDHVGDGADFVDGVKSIDGFGGVWHADGDFFAFFGADSFESGGDFIDFFDEFFVGDLGFKIFKREERKLLTGSMHCLLSANEMRIH